MCQAYLCFCSSASEFEPVGTECVCTPCYKLMVLFEKSHATSFPFLHQGVALSLKKILECLHLVNVQALW